MECKWTQNLYSYGIPFSFLLATNANKRGKELYV